MTDSTENEDKIHEGTEMLQDIANDVEAEREKAGHSASLPSDEAEEAAGPDLEDPKDDETLPEELGDVPVHPPARPMM